MSSPLLDLLDQLHEASRSTRGLGDRFERLFAQVLRTDPQFADRFSEVWLWKDWPDRGKKVDTGIDLVAKERDGEGLCAIQCKFYDPDHRIEKADLDSFFATSGKAPFTSRMVVSTTDKWSKHAEDLLEGQQIPCVRVRLQDLQESAIDWAKFRLDKPDQMSLKKRYAPRDHQKAAIGDVMAGFETADRGKLIMACGTGKTYTALKIAEAFGRDAKKKHQGRILFLVPSIALLSQTLREWISQCEMSLHSLAVCSDAAVGRVSESEDIRVHDLPFPATTNGKKLAKQLEAIAAKRDLTVVFSTYQSIEAIHVAQKAGAPDFDLIICDEAHRTTGVTLSGEDESHFVKVHDSEYLKGKRRLYMTATPRIYMDTAKSKAKEAEAELASMDDEALFGREFHRLGFGEAIGKELLADYKVMVLAVDEKFVSKAFQKELAEAQRKSNREYSDYFSDLVKVTGCWNGLAKRMAGAEEATLLAGDTAPMRRAVAFSRSIAASKQIKELFGGIVDKYIADADERDRPSLLQCEVDHVDGTMNALVRNHLLDWLKADTGEESRCRILSNARCLSEGVDVPALDAVLFLNPRNSVVDVVQAVGRVMRRAEGKKYGYIILPVGIPADIDPEEALKDNDKYKVVWQVLQALRSHDERIEAAINTIDLTGKRPESISVIGVGDWRQPGDDETAKGAVKERPVRPGQLSLDFPHLDAWRDAIFAKLVLKVGDRRYWESWAKDVAEIAERQIVHIQALIEDPDPKIKARWHFDRFLAGLQRDLNPTVSESDAIEMLAQHAITQPVFDALFAEHSFTAQNPVSKDLNRVLATLRKHGLGQGEEGKLDRFYDSVRLRVAGIATPEGRQRVVIELYDKFFRTAFPRTADRLGIVYTPLEIVDFIIKSVDDVLQQEFGERLTSPGVQILDPFTGTGTFIVRLLQGGFIRPEDLQRKYRGELHANELVLLAYYIAAVNIEAAYHDLRTAAGEKEHYEAFPGIVLTDTFRMAETSETFVDELFAENDERVARQREADIRVILGNPPYSVGQGDANANNQNQKYPRLDARIRDTYVAKSSATLVNSLYDSYLRAIRWASDRIKDRGIVCFVTNSGFVDKGTGEGVRRTLVEEFTKVFVFNLRGDQRTAGEQSKKEGGKVFGSGSRAGVAITVLVKNPKTHSDGKVRYFDIGDYLTREAKLARLQELGGAGGVNWQAVVPDQHGDWINTRDPAFGGFLALREKEAGHEAHLFADSTPGISSGRDTWVYGSSYGALGATVGRLIKTYNDEVVRFERNTAGKGEAAKTEPKDLVAMDSTRIKWTRGLLMRVAKGERIQFSKDALRVAMYRPFQKQWVYYSPTLNESPGRIERFFPIKDEAAHAIVIGGHVERKGFSVLMVRVPPDLGLLDAGPCLPRFIYERTEGGLFENGGSVASRRETITDKALAQFRTAYSQMEGAPPTKEDIFYYTYGVLHSMEYRTRFEADLQKILPRVPFAKDFRAFEKAGRALAALHVDYETVEPYPLGETAELNLGGKDTYRVDKMSWAKRRIDGKLVADKTTLIYNTRLTLTGIPPEALEYVVNGKPAIEGLMDQYQVWTDKESGIINDPNDWATEHNDPAYIYNLVKRIVRVSVETVRIVKELPALEELKT